MGPKPKITREDILRHAYHLVIEQGAAAISSRSVAQAAGCSVQPIYSHFPTMDELKQETYRYACRQCAIELLEGRDSRDFVTVLTQWMLDLAKSRPNLFRFLYLSDVPGGVLRLPKARISANSHIEMARKISCCYGISLEDGKDILVRICLFLMGICATVCINQMDVTDEQVLALAGRTVFDMVEGCRRRTETLETADLILRPWTPGDASWLYTYASNPNVAKASGWPCHTSPEESLRVITTCYQVPGTYAIVPKHLGHPAGCIRLLSGSAALIPGLPENQGQIRFWLGEPFWGRGYVPEAVDALIAHGFQDLNLQAIWCICQADNLSSRAVFSKCGFSQVPGENKEKCLVRIENI